MSHDLIEEYLAKTKNPVQLVKHFDEVPESKITYPLIGQIKYDGLYCLLVIEGGTPSLISRTGKPFWRETISATEEHYFRDMKCTLSDGVYITELCNDAVSLEVLAGLVSTNRKKEWTEEESALMYDEVYFVFHDYLTLAEFTSGSSELDYTIRYNELECNLRLAGLLNYLVQNNWIHSRDEADEYAANKIAHGHEGAIFKHDTGWVAGHKGWRVVKIVRGLVLDLLCTGVEYGKGKREGQIAKLQFAYKGNVFSADLGKGWTDARRDALTIAHECPNLENNPNYIGGEATPVGKIWEVKALQESSTGKALRLPKVVRVREDKEEPDA